MALGGSIFQARQPLPCCRQHGLLAKAKAGVCCSWHLYLVAGTPAEWPAPLLSGWHSCMAIGTPAWHLPTSEAHLCPPPKVPTVGGREGGSCPHPTICPLPLSPTQHKPPAFPPGEGCFWVGFTLMAVGRAARAVPAPGLVPSWCCHCPVTSAGSPRCCPATPWAR